MARYIDACELAEEINSLKISLGGKDIFSDRAKDSVLRLIDEQPTADVVEVKHGEWINGRYNDFQDNVYEEQCSICGRYSKDYGRDFCPNCGAKMDGGKK